MKRITKIIHVAFTVVGATLGALTANGAPGDLFVSITTPENGGGSVYRFKPTGQQTIFASSLSRPRGLAFNPRSGNLFVANNTFDGSTYHASIVQITPRGVQSTFATFNGNLKAEGLVFDRTGNLFAAVVGQTSPPYPTTIYKFTPNGVQRRFGSVPGFVVGDLVFDSAGNLFAGDAYYAYIYKFAPGGSRSVYAGPSAFGTDQYPGGLAFDGFGNLFVSTEAGSPAGNDVILKFTPTGVESTFATDLDWPNSLHFDGSGKMFVAEIGEFAPPGNVLTFTPDGTKAVFAPGLNVPIFLTFQP